MDTIKLDLRLNLPADFLHSVFTTAVEGGVTWWDVLNYKWATPEGKDELQEFFAHVDVHEGAPLPIATPLDSDRPRRVYVRRSTILKGIQRVMDREGGIKIHETLRGEIAAAIVTGDAGQIDAEQADIILQAALFNEIVFG